jgi:hypothetical protein
MAQYTWALEGATLYFGEVRVAANIKLKIMANGMLIMLAVNFVDFFRNMTLTFLILSVHCWCKSRARRVRRGQPVRELP